MVTKVDFLNQVVATQTPEQFITLIKNTYRDVCKEELLEKISTIQSATDIIELIKSVNDFGGDEIATSFLEKIESVVPSIENRQELLQLKKYLADPVIYPIIYWESEQYSTVRVSIISQLMRICDEMDELENFLNVHYGIFVFQQILQVFWKRHAFLVNRKSISELREICEDYPVDYSGDDKTATVDEFISRWIDFSDFDLLYRLSNEAQKQKVLEKAITLCETTSDVDEIAYKYPEDSDIRQRLITRRATLPQDGDADV